MHGISRSRGWDKEIRHHVLPVEQLVLSDKWARICYSLTQNTEIWFRMDEYMDAIMIRQTDDAKMISLILTCLTKA